MKIVLETEPRNLPALDITFADKRIERLLFNYRTNGSASAYRATTFSRTCGFARSSWAFSRQR
jgi:exonuclease I